MPSTLEAAAIRRALSLRDLTDPSRGPHAMQLLLQAITSALERAWRCGVHERRDVPLVDVSENYDALGYPEGGAARDARYTRYLSDHILLRTQTSAMIPGALRELREPRDDLLVCPGLVYRRDTIDRLHVGEPHQVDLWRVREGTTDGADLLEMIGLVLASALPGARWRSVEAEHPYTLQGLQVDAEVKGSWVEVLECGLASPRLLERAGLDPARYAGLAMGLGLDRLLMLRKGIPDIRLLRSTDPRVASQLLDLEPWREVSSMPPVRRDMSIVVAADRTPEELGDRVRAALGARAASLETVEVTAETTWETLPEGARRRLAMRPGQKNVLLRVVIRDLSRTLTSHEANELRDAIYAAVHEGAVQEWAAAPPT